MISVDGCSVHINKIVRIVAEFKESTSDSARFEQCPKKRH